MDELGHVGEGMEDEGQDTGVGGDRTQGWRRQDTRVDEIGHVGEGMDDEGQDTRVGGDMTQGWMR